MEVADCPAGSQAPWMGSSYFAAVGSALDDLGSVVVAYIDWDHFALHDVDEAAHDSSYHFDTLKRNQMNCFCVKLASIYTHTQREMHSKRMSNHVITIWRCIIEWI